MPAFLFSRVGLVGMAAALLLALFGVQEIRLKLALHGETAAKASLVAASGRLTASESFRASEAHDAATALSDAETACAARVARAVRSGSGIRKIVEAPHALDPATHCPVRVLVGADQLRDAVRPPD